VMMEKPLAVSLAAGRAIADAAKKNNIQVVVNYETTWYPGNQTAHQIVTTDHAIGDLRKMIACDGHPGPVEIGCSKTFLSWLTDPKLNGGGALRDFGCYGADLFTWLMGDQRPTSVTAVTQHIKPAIYPRVEDEGTIIVTYPKAQGIIQASWNWPYSRKDLQIYGTSGYVLVPDKETLRIREGNGAESERKLSNSDLAGSLPDQLSYLVAVVRGEIQPSGLSGLRDNLIVTEILDAARKSARTGKRVDLPKKSPY
jgi:predicted dehydrogenase